MEILASKNVIEGKEISILHKMQLFWIVLSPEDNFDEIENIEENFFIIDEEMIYERIPNLKGNLEQPVETTININYSTGEININKKHFHLGIPSHGAKATRQANVDFSFFKWIINYRERYFKILIITLALFVCAMLWGWFFYIPMALYLAFQILTSLKERDMFKSGDLCAAVVIDAANQKIAAYTDLTLGFGKFPIIRIKKVRLPKKYRKAGARIPVAGGYQKTEAYPHWNFYNPLPLPSGIKNDKEINNILNLIPTMEWVKLNNEIKKFDKIPVEGYYPLDIDNTSWKGIDLNAINWIQIKKEPLQKT